MRLVDKTIGLIPLLLANPSPDDDELGSAGVVVFAWLTRRQNKGDQAVISSHR